MLACCSCESATSAWARSVTDAVHDPRDPAQVEYSIEQLVRQRLLAIAAGFEDLNDHDQLRFDGRITFDNAVIPSVGSGSDCEIDGVISINPQSSYTVP